MWIEEVFIFRLSLDYRDLLFIIFVLCSKFESSLIYNHHAAKSDMEILLVMRARILFKKKRKPAKKKKIPNMR